MILSRRCNIYIASCEEDGGIYHYQTDGEGGISLLKKYSLDRPMHMIISGDRLYCLLRAPFGDCDSSGLVSFRIEEDGSLSGETSVQSTEGVVACHLAEIDGEIYCANYLSGSVIKVPDTLVVHSGHGVNRQRQESSHTHYIGQTPDHKFVLVTDLGLDKIFLYSKDLTLHSVTDMPPGCGPRHLAIHGDGKTIFCANELNSTISVLEYESESLFLKDTVSTLPSDFEGVSACAAIRCEGEKVYVSNRGHDSIAIFNYGDGKLQLEGFVQTHGSETRDFWLDEEVFICANQFSDNVTVIHRENHTLLYQLVIKKPVCVVCLENANRKNSNRKSEEKK